MKTTFHIPRIKCDGCAATIRKAMEGFNSIHNVEISVSEKTLNFETENAENFEEVKRMLESVGYPVSEQS